MEVASLAPVGVSGRGGSDIAGGGSIGEITQESGLNFRSRSVVDLLRLRLGALVEGCRDKYACRSGVLESWLEFPSDDAMLPEYRDPGPPKLNSEIRFRGGCGEDIVDLGGDEGAESCGEVYGGNGDRGGENSKTCG